MCSPISILSAAFVIGCLNVVLALPAARSTVDLPASFNVARQTCFFPLTACSNTGCTDLQEDPANCGSCGNSCTPYQVCIVGECTCAPGYDLCDGGCIAISDFQSDPNNCNGCGYTCAAGLVCSQGACEIETVGGITGGNHEPCHPAFPGAPCVEEV